MNVLANGSPLARFSAANPIDQLPPELEYLDQMAQIEHFQRELGLDFGLHRKK